MSATYNVTINLDQLINKFHFLVEKLHTAEQLTEFVELAAKVFPRNYDLSSFKKHIERRLDQIGQERCQAATAYGLIYNPYMDKEQQRATEDLVRSYKDPEGWPVYPFNSADKAVSND
jgi:hypothetical protein